MTAPAQLPCIACNRPADSFVERGDTRIFRCKNCDLVFGAPISAAPIDEDASMFPTYAAFIESAAARYPAQAACAKRMVASRLQFYRSELGRSVESVLEIGCNTGAWAPAFIASGVDYMGVEVLPEMAEFARRQTNANILTGDFLELAIEKTFDVVFLSQVFEHIRYPVPFLEKIRALCPNGVLHLDVPNHDSLMSDIRKRFHKREYGFVQPPYHMVAYTTSSLQKLLKFTGFDVTFVKPLANNDKVFGQLVSESFLPDLVYRVSDILGKGSLLVGVAH